MKTEYKTFENCIKALCLPAPIKEFHTKVPYYLRNFKLDIPKTHWRIDYCWPEYKLALEIEGGAFLGGGHNRGSGFRRDIIKYNTIIHLGFTLYRFMPEHLPFKSTYAITLIEEYFKHFEQGGKNAC